MTRRIPHALGCAGAALVLFLGGAIAATAWLRDQEQIPPLPFEQRCVVSGSTGTVTLSLEQTRLTSIIVGGAVKRELNPRAATIAMATAYQESDIRNLDHGDRDSLGLFQQRPSQGWGTVDQIQDPWYSTGAFYAALVKIPDWQTGDVNDTAQRVQRSGHPEAYRKHDAKARILAEVFTGRHADGVTCFDKRTQPGSAQAYAAAVTKTLGALPVTSAGKMSRVTAGSPERAWAVAHHAVANAGELGITKVSVAGHTWTADSTRAPAWRQEPSDGEASTVVISLR